MLVKSNAKDSGVVINMCGGFFNILVLSAVVVSPVLTPILILISFPYFFAISSISCNGLSKFTSKSYERDLSGFT